MSMNVALNIGNNSLRILAARGRQVKRWGSQALPEDVVRDGLILQPKAAAEAIDLLFKSTKIPRERVITSLSGLSFTYRFLDLPRLKPSQMEEAILRAVKKEITLPLEELYLSWQCISGKGDELNYFVLGTPRKPVDALVQTLNIAGITPYQVDAKPLALARAANRTDAIIANIESDGFDIVFIANGIPTVLHTISPRGEGATLEDNLQRLTDELNKTVAFYQSSHPENQLNADTSLLITGELAAESAASGLLQAEVEYPVEPLVPPLDIPSDLPVELFAADMGLILKRLPKKSAHKEDTARFYDIDINILSGKYRKSRKRSFSTGQLLVFLVIMIAVGALYPLYYARSQLIEENLKLDDELQIINRELNMAVISSEIAVQNEERLNELTGNITLIRAEQRLLLNSRGEYYGYTELMTGLLPPATDFTSIEIWGDAITIEGEADSVFAVVEFADALESSGEFTGVRIGKLDETGTMTDENSGNNSASANNLRIMFTIYLNK